MKTYVITNDSARAAATLASLASLNPEIFDGVKPSTLTRESEELKIIRGSTKRVNMLYGHVGCALAHARLWRVVAEQTEPCLIVEDDAVLKEGTDLDSLPDCNFLWLYSNPNPETNPLPVGVSEFARLYDPGTVAYRLTPEGARILLECYANPDGFEGLQFPNHVDLSLIDLLGAIHFEAKVLYPHPFSHEDGGVSTIIESGYISEAVVKPRTLVSKTKRELVDGLIALDKAKAFADLIDKLPIAERLRWEASPTVSPSYPFLVDNRKMVVSSLGITDEQFDKLFA
jgi:GR25 family glycosyltransferase involved in LPS biosynthesis